MVFSFCRLKPEGDQGGEGGWGPKCKEGRGWRGSAEWVFNQCLDGWAGKRGTGRVGWWQMEEGPLSHPTYVELSVGKVSIFTLLPSCQINLRATVFFQ